MITVRVSDMQGLVGIKLFQDYSVEVRVKPLVVEDDEDLDDDNFDRGQPIVITYADLETVLSDGRAFFNFTG